MRDLVEKANGGDLEAFGSLIDHYKDMVYGASYAILGNFHDAQDVSQDALVQAWQELGTLKDCGGFPGWLYRITRNLSIDRLRRSRARTGSIDDVTEVLPDPGNKDPRQCAEQRELHEAVLEAIRCLSEPNRLATALFYINGYSIEEVADFLDVPTGTVKRRLHDSRTQLRERMVNMVEDTFRRNSLSRDFSGETLRRIGDFACLDKIGAGPMGSVYLAEHPVLKHNVAIKIAANGRAELQELFRMSRVALDSLNHPGFVKVLSHGEHEGRPYVVMEYLQDSMNLQGWNIGVLMYELLVGKPLFDGDSANKILWAIQSPRPVDLVALKDRAPDYVVSVLEACLEKAPQHRFPSTAELLDALEEAQFADLVRLSDYDTQRLLLDVETGILAAALGGAAEEIAAHLFRNVRRTVADQIRQEIPERPPTPDAAHAARLAVVATASRLFKEQRISFQIAG